MASSVLTKLGRVSVSCCFVWPLTAALWLFAPSSHAEDPYERSVTAAPLDPNAPEAHWLDTGHAYVTDSAQALTVWMDNFFGDPTFDRDVAESRVRLQLVSSWDEEEGFDVKPRARGKVQLPKISRRLELVFSDDDLDQEELEDTGASDEIGLQYRLDDEGKTRLDATLSATSSGPKPGLRLTYNDAITERLSQRLVQRVQYESDEGWYSTTRYDLNHKVNDDNVVRWTNRVIYGEETAGVEWRTRIALRQRRFAYTDKPTAAEYFAAVNGITDPDFMNSETSFGVTFRRQVFRDYLFMELEPAYNFRKETPDSSRDGVFSIIFRIDILLRKDLVKRTSESEDND